MGSRVAPRRLPAVAPVLVLLFVGLNVHGVYEIPVGPIDVPPWSMAALLALAIAWWPGRSLSALFDTRVLFGIPALTFGFTVFWMFASILWTSEPFVAFAVAGVQTINYGLLVSWGSVHTDGASMRSLNRVVFLVGVAFAAVALVLFAPALLRYPALPAVEGLGWLIDRGIALRARGLTSDPNFFSLYLSLPLFIGLSQRDVPYRVVGTMLIAAALFTAQSRTFVLACVITLPLSLLLAGRMAPRARRRIVRVALAVGGLAGAGLALVVWQSSVLRESIVARVQSIEAQNRIPRWLEAWAEFEDPLFGSGLMSLTEELGRFSHNTYIDVFIELGLVGFSAWMVFLMGVTLLWVRRVQESTLPWFQLWLLTIVMSPAFSLLYNPVYILPTIVLISTRPERSSGVPIAPHRLPLNPRRVDPSRTGPGSADRSF